MQIKDDFDITNCEKLPIEDLTEDEKALAEKAAKEDILMERMISTIVNKTLNDSK